MFAPTITSIISSTSRSSRISPRSIPRSRIVRTTARRGPTRLVVKISCSRSSRDASPRRRAITSAPPPVASARSARKPAKARKSPRTEPVSGTGSSAWRFDTASATMSSFELQRR
jgi:hypothetical protein